jgi:hypothetical protein
MEQQLPDSEIIEIITLLTYYGFDLKGYSAIEIMTQWLQEYNNSWIRLAVVEALYQGRYKAVSVEQILGFWVRRNQPQFHFTPDFERLISRKLPQEKVVLPECLQEVAPEDEQAPESDLEKPEQAIILDSAVIKDEEKPQEQLSKPENPEVSEKTEEVKVNDHWSIHVVPQPIDQFIPQDDASDFFWKLKKFALYRLNAGENNQ